MLFLPLCIYPGQPEAGTFTTPKRHLNAICQNVWSDQSGLIKNAFKCRGANERPSLSDGKVISAQIGCAQKDEGDAKANSINNYRFREFVSAAGSPSHSLSHSPKVQKLISPERKPRRRKKTFRNSLLNTEEARTAAPRAKVVSRAIFYFKKRRPPRKVAASFKKQQIRRIYESHTES